MKMLLLLLLLLLLLSGGVAQALNNNLGQRPPMGYSTWNDAGQAPCCGDPALATAH